MINSKTEKDIILVIDGTNLIYRNYFVHSYRKTKSGIHTGGLYGTIRSLRNYINNFNPKQVFICFDKSNNTFRNEMYPDYKTNRKKTDIELKNQFPMLREYCKLVNMPFIEMDLYEADDIIGSLCCNSDKYNIHPYAVSGDRDLLQLIAKGIDIIYLSNKGPVVYGEKEFTEEYGMHPNQFIDHKALMGDSSDNIPGVPGIGKKTSAKLLGLYGSLKGIYENIDELKGKQKQMLIENKNQAYLSKELSIIKCDMELDYDDYLIRCLEEGFNLDNESVKEFLKELEIEGI